MINTTYRLLSVATIVLILLYSCNGKGATTSTQESAEQTTEDTFVPDEHTSQSSLDWDGEYEGIIPCADCDGIKINLMLNSDNTFVRTIIHLGQSENQIKDEGKFEWDKNGNDISFLEKQNETKIKIGENRIMYLIKDGEMINDEVADKYVLIKK